MGERAITAPDLKRWLYRYISQYAGWQSEEARQMGRLKDEHYRKSAEALDKLGAYVQQLPDDDQRLVRLAAAYPPHRSLADLASPNLQSRLTRFGPRLYAGDDPDQFISDDVELEIASLRQQR